MKRTFILFVALYAIASGGISAQTLAEQQFDKLIDNHKIFVIDDSIRSTTPAENDSAYSIISDFYYDQFRHFQDPAAPYFMFMSKDSQLAMGVGGAVRMRAWFDWSGAINSSAFAPYLIPIVPDPLTRSNFDSTPAGTALFFKVIGRRKSLGTYQLYIEANFKGGTERRDFQIKKAYAIINDFTIGYAPSTFSDPSAMPPTIDAQGPNNNLNPTNVLVRFMHTFKNEWVIAVSAETPDSRIGADGTTTAACKDWMPDYAAFVQYQCDNAHHVRLSGIVRTLTYRDMISEKNHSKLGWGVQLSSKANLHDRLTTYLYMNYGHGIESLGGDLAMGNYDLIVNPNKAGNMYTPAMLGWCVGLQYNFKPNLFSSVSFSQERFMPEYAVASDEYKYGLYCTANIFWDATPRIRFGAEMNLGMRQNFDGEHRWARRAELLAQFSF